MVYENLVGLNVINDEVYQAYRFAMMPLLIKIGGGFGYDFKVNEVLKSQVKHPINRVFTIYFPDKQTMDVFFSDQEYLKIKETFFERSVEHAVIISSYFTE